MFYTFIVLSILERQAASYLSSHKMNSNTANYLVFKLFTDILIDSQ